MDVSVVVCTYALDTYDHFREAVESIFEQTHDDIELVVVVDGTREIYERVLEEFGDRDDVIVDCNAENRGLLRSRNRGAEIATGDIVAFIDDDAVADPLWIEQLVDAYETRDVIAAGGRMTPIWVAGRPTFLPPEFYWLIGVSHDGFADGAGEVRNTFGSNISFRRDVFLDLGGFNPDIGGRKGDSNLQGEEAELCVRMKREYDHGVWYVPDAEVGHKVFGYRTDPRWLLGRAFWQGYSKRAMEVLVPDSNGEEGEFLRRLIGESVPSRLRSMLRGDVLRNGLQLLSLLLLTVAVGLGYLYGLTRWRRSTVEDRSDVCVVTHPLADPGETATRTLLDVLSELTAVSLITANLPADSAMRDRYEVVELTEKGAGQSNVLVAAVRFVRNQLRMCREIGRRDEDVMLFFGATSYLVPILFARAVGKTVVLEPRGDVPLSLRLNWERRLPSPLAWALSVPVSALERAGYAASDAIITYTPGMAPELGVDRFEHKLYPNGARYVDTDRFRPVTPFDERDRTVGFVGRLDEEKGVRTLIDVAKLLPDDVTFRFVGDGAMRGLVETELSDEIEHGSVVVTGWVEHEAVPRELNELRLLVMPSQPTEGLPTSILESLACGTPVYATPVSGVPDVVREGETGLHMARLDHREIASTIVSAFDGDDLYRMSSNGRSLIDDRYDFEASVERYRRILRELSVQVEEPERLRAVR